MSNDPFPFPLSPRESIWKEESIEHLNLQVACKLFKPSIIGKPKVDEGIKGNFYQMNHLTSSKEINKRIKNKKK